MYTYQDIAKQLDTTTGALHIIASKKISPLVPSGRDGRKLLFSQETVDAFKVWWRENEIYRSAHEHPEGEVFDIDAALAYLADTDGPMPLTTMQHVRRRFNKLWPDFYQKHPIRGRPRAMYYKKTLDEYKTWVAAGQPELRIASMVFDEPGFEVMAVFEDGVTVGIDQNGVASVSPKMPSEKTEPYVSQVRMVAQRKLRTHRRKRAKGVS